MLIDDRHKELKVLDFSEITKRRFASWSLRSITLERWMTKEPELKKLMPFNSKFHYSSDALPNPTTVTTDKPS